MTFQEITYRRDLRALVSLFCAALACGVGCTVAHGDDAEGERLGEAASASCNPFIRWTAQGNMLTARSEHAASLLPNNNVLVTGGFSAQGTILAQAEVFSPGNPGFWTSTGSLNQARREHTSTHLGSGSQTLICGGQVPQNTMTATCEQYDGTGFQFVGSLPVPVMSHTATLLNDGTVLVTGGLTNAFVATTSAAIFVPFFGGGFWESVGPLNQGRLHHTATLLPDGTVLIAGGDDNQGHVFASAEIYNPATQKFQSIAPMPNTHSWHTATPYLSKPGKILIAGGLTSQANEVYDSATQTWTTISIEQNFRYAAGAYGLAVFGGFTTTPPQAQSEAEYAGFPFGVEPSMITARAAFTTTPLSNGLVLVAGGMTNGATGLANTELLHPICFVE
jgi:hypothetical protein